MVGGVTVQAPEGLTVGGSEAASLVVSWNEASGTVSYNVYRSLSADGTYAFIIRITDGRTYTGLVMGTTYYYSFSVTGGKYHIQWTNSSSTGEASTVVIVSAYWNSGNSVTDMKTAYFTDKTAMRVNYFIAILGELLQRMKDPNAKYSIALPNMEQFVRLWSKLPSLAKERTKISCLFVDVNGKIVEK
jgi:hypothetical protein